MQHSYVSQRNNCYSSKINSLSYPPRQTKRIHLVWSSPTACRSHLSSYLVHRKLSLRRLSFETQSTFLELTTCRTISAYKTLSFRITSLSLTDISLSERLVIRNYFVPFHHWKHNLSTWQTFFLLTELFRLLFSYLFNGNGSQLVRKVFATFCDVLCVKQVTNTSQ